MTRLGLLALVTAVVLVVRHWQRKAWQASEFNPDTWRVTRARRLWR
jgi:hypothetical protein